MKELESATLSEEKWNRIISASFNRKYVGVQKPVFNAILLAGREGREIL